MKHLFHTLMTLTAHTPWALHTYAADINSEQAVRTITNQGFLFTYLLAGRQENIDRQLILFVTDAKGEPVNDAQVIFTVIDMQGTNLLAEATPINGGYALGLNGWFSSVIRIETVVATARGMLIDNFHLTAERMDKAA